MRLNPILSSEEALLKKWYKQLNSFAIASLTGLQQLFGFTELSSEFKHEVKFERQPSCASAQLPTKVNNINATHMISASACFPLLLHHRRMIGSPERSKSLKIKLYLQRVSFSIGYSHFYEASVNIFTKHSP